MSSPADGLAPLAPASRPDRPWLAGALAASVVLHAFAVLVVPRRPRVAPRKEAAPTQVIDIETAPPPAPQPVAAPPPPIPAKEPAPARAAAKSPAHKGPPPLAQAGQVVTRKPAAAEPLDFTDELVTGGASGYAGGTTAAAGTSRAVVRGAAAPPAAAGPPDGPTGPESGGDLSRPPSMASESTWKCPFPPEANGVDQALVQLRVFVDGAGKALDAAVLVDPGHGFGAEAVRCAMGTRWEPALDRAGTPIRATAIVRVRFTR